MIERQFETKIKRLRSYGGGEYIPNRLKTYLSSIGIIHDNSPAYSHESNGIAERFNQTITTMARTMLQLQGLNSVSGGKQSIPLYTSKTDFHTPA